MVLPFVKLHLRYVRKPIVQRSDYRDKFTGDVQPLLTHSGLGHHFTTNNISDFIATFKRNVNPHQKLLTEFTLSASFATSMLHQYGNGKLKSDVSEERFAELTAKQMYTPLTFRRPWSLCQNAFWSSSNLKNLTKKKAIHSIIIYGSSTFIIILINISWKLLYRINGPGKGQLYCISLPYRLILVDNSVGCRLSVVYCHMPNELTSVHKPILPV